MKKTILLSLYLICSSLIFAHNYSVKIQEEENATTQNQENSSVKNTAVNVGVLMGGGSLIGVDLELLIPQTQLGLQVGAGISSIGAGINYHFKKTLSSPFISLQYWRQGFGDNYYASYVGPMYVYRYKKLFQAGIGFASIIETGRGWDRYFATRETPPPFALLYNIGIYF